RSAERLDEKFFQALWNEQFFKPEMKLKDGRELRVVSPGTWNLEAGPDFQRAIIQIDGQTQRGAVEIHRHAGDWWQHGHTEDENYRDVILHVVWTGDGSDTADGLPPCFVMSDHLDRPWRSASDEIRIDTDYPYARKVGPGACSKYLSRADTESIRNMLRIAGLARFREKAGRLQRETVAKGAEQAFYEGLFEALGYKANKVNFRTLARHLPLEYLRNLRTGNERFAALFGAAGLLPDVTQSPLEENMRSLVKELWSLWWPLGMTTVEGEWKKNGTRPYNSPLRRLAAGYELMERWQWQPARAVLRIAREEAGREEDGAQRLLQRIAEQMSFSSGWDAWADFDKPLTRSAHLLGRERINDIVVNVVLPFIWSRGEGAKGASDDLQTLAEAAYLTVPRLQSNRRTIEAGHRFFIPPSKLTKLAKKAAEQQGILALYRDFCLRSFNACDECPLAEPGLFEKLRC
ncbi:MAG: DUF2851 family protein, partial [Lentisphaeria bacterium]